MTYKDFFEKFLYEAPDDDPPDSDMSNNQDPPDITDEQSEIEEPPDLDGDIDGGTGDDMPPDMNDDFDNITDDMEDESSGESSEDINPMKLDEKISAIMNKQLYQRFLKLLSIVNDKISSLKKNNDILYSISNESSDVLNSLNRLDENIRLYLDNKFINEDYGINFFFFNKCLNLFKLLNDDFNDKIKKSIKSVK